MSERSLNNKKVGQRLSNSPAKSNPDTKGGTFHSFKHWIESVYKVDSDKISSFSRRRESSLFNGFWIPRSSRRMTTHDFIHRLYIGA